MRIHIPNSAFLGNIDPFLRGFDPGNPGRLEITANPKWISVHPMGLAMIASLGLEAPAGKVRCAPFEARSAHYLLRMGLFRFLKAPFDQKIVEHEPAGRFIPLTQVRTGHELSTFLADMIPLLHLAPNPARTIGYVVSELVNNVIEHAESPGGAVLCAQYYKKSNSIRVGIADRGVGIKATISRSHAAESDLDAIRLALWPGITGATRREGGTEQNAGAGLFFIKSIASVNRDFFVLYSGSGLYKLLKRPASRRERLTDDPFRDRHSKEGSLPPWRGTVIGVDITLNQTEEFTRLLDAIRETYGAAVRKRRRERYRRPRFL